MKKSYVKKGLGMMCAFTMFVGSISTGIFTHETLSVHAQENGVSQGRLEEIKREYNTLLTEAKSNIKDNIHFEGGFELLQEDIMKIEEEFEKVKEDVSKLKTLVAKIRLGLEAYKESVHTSLEDIKTYLRTHGMGNFIREVNVDGILLNYSSYVYENKKRQPSMADKVMAKPFRVYQTDRGYYLKAAMKSLNFMGFKGFLGELSYFDIENPKDSSKEGVDAIKIEPMSSYEVQDSFNNTKTGTDSIMRGKKYPKELFVPVKYNKEDVTLQVYVPVMGTFGTDIGTQKCILKLDWSKVLKQDEESMDPVTYWDYKVDSIDTIDYDRDINTIIDLRNRYDLFSSEEKEQLRNHGKFRQLELQIIDIIIEKLESIPEGYTNFTDLIKTRFKEGLINLKNEEPTGDSIEYLSGYEQYKAFKTAFEKLDMEGSVYTISELEKADFEVDLKDIHLYKDGVNVTKAGRDDYSMADSVITKKGKLIKRGNKYFVRGTFGPEVMLYMPTYVSKMALCSYEKDSTGYGYLENGSEIKYLKKYAMPKEQLNKVKEFLISMSVSLKGLSKEETIDFYENNQEGVKIVNNFNKEHIHTFEFEIKKDQIASMIKFTVAAMESSMPNTYAQLTIDRDAWEMMKKAEEIPMNKWVNKDSNWYYYDAKGMMLKNTFTPDGHRVNAEGKYVTATWKKNTTGWWYEYNDGYYPTKSWQKISDKWYYFDERGYMTTGWQKISANWYYMAESGEMLTGWQKVSGEWYYMAESGEMLTGWQKVSENWYYMKESGAMASNQWIGNYYLGSSGAMLTNTTTPDGYRVDENGKWIN